MGSPETEKTSDVFAVVPSHNHAAFIEQCLRSIIGQTLQPKKLLVIDDGSSDGSPQIIEAALADCHFDCELIARENRGLSATLNQAFENSDGAFFAYLGSDDVWLPEFLEKQTQLLIERPDAVLAFAHAYIVDEKDRIVGSTREWSDFADGDLQPMLLAGTIFSSPGVLYRRSALKGHRWNESARLEDYEMYLRLSIDGEFARNSEILCVWRQHGENESRNLPEMFPEIIAAQDRVAPDLGIDRKKLDSIQSRVKFEAADNFIRHGFRREAARLFMENLDGAPSIERIARTGFRLLVPQSLFQWNRRRKRDAAATRYGRLADVMKQAR